MNVRRLLVASLLLMFGVAPMVWSQNVAFERAQNLQHGINLSGWFDSRDLSPQHIASFTNASDLKAIHAMGFDFVRLGVDPSLIERHGEVSAANPEMLSS